MKRPIHLAIAVPLLVLGAYAVAQTGARPPKPPTVVKPAGAGATNTKIMSTPSSGAAMKAEKAQGAGSLAPPPPGNAAIKGNSAIGGSGAIKGESAAIKGNSAIGGSGAINGGSMKADKAQGAIKGNSAIGGSGAITGGTMKADKAQGAIKGESAAIKGAPAGALQSPAAR